jgi:hypothetical protein
MPAGKEREPTGDAIFNEGPTRLLAQSSARTARRLLLTRGGGPLMLRHSSLCSSGLRSGKVMSVNLVCETRSVSGVRESRRDLEPILLGRRQDLDDARHGHVAAGDQSIIVMLGEDGPKWANHNDALWQPAGRDTAPADPVCMTLEPRCPTTITTTVAAIARVLATPTASQPAKARHARFDYRDSPTAL